MPQAVWTGDISFGLVNIPVKLYSATEPKRVRFHQYEAGTGRRIRYARVATGPAPEPVAPPSDPAPEETEAGAQGEPLIADEEPDSDRADAWTAPESEATTEPDGPPPPEDEEVPWEEIVRGYEIEPGRVVTVSSEELLSLAPERSRMLEVEQFVELDDIDPVHFEKSYYVVPQGGRGAERPYWLLYRAMADEGKVAVGRFVMRTKEYLVAIRPGEHVLMLETLFYADEVRDPKEAWVPLVDEPSERELNAARSLIDALTAEWEPTRHRDKYRETLLELLHSKAEEALIVRDEEDVPEADTGTITDLLTALQASVEAAKQSRRDTDEATETG